MLIVRRTLLLWFLMFWQGGFLFYGAIVVTIGSEVLGSDFRQGMITRRVAEAMNWTGILVLLAWIWDLCMERQAWLRLRWATWAFLMMTVLLLMWLYPQMDALIDLEKRTLLDRDHFRDLHRWYLRVSTAQWLGAIVFTVLTLRNWSAQNTACLALAQASGER